MRKYGDLGFCCLAASSISLIRSYPIFLQYSLVHSVSANRIFWFNLTQLLLDFMMSKATSHDGASPLGSYFYLFTFQIDRCEAAVLFTGVAAVGFTFAQGTRTSCRCFFHDHGRSGS